MPAPSPRTNPSRFLSNGRLACAASSLKLWERARMLLNPSAWGQLSLRAADLDNIVFSGGDQSCSRHDRQRAAGACGTDVVGLSVMPKTSERFATAEEASVWARQTASSGAPAGIPERSSNCDHLNIRASCASVDHGHFMRKGFRGIPRFQNRLVSGGNRHSGVRGHEAFVLLGQNRTLRIGVRFAGNLAFQSEFAPLRLKTVPVLPSLSASMFCASPSPRGVIRPRPEITIRSLMKSPSPVEDLISCRQFQFEKPKSPDENDCSAPSLLVIYRRKRKVQRPKMESPAFFDFTTAHSAA